MRYASYRLQGIIAGDPVAHLTSPFAGDDSIYPVADTVTDTDVAAAIERAGGCSAQTGVELNTVEIFLDSNGAGVWDNGVELEMFEDKDPTAAVVQALEAAAKR